MPGPLAAVLWDFDGTLADTRRRNYDVVRRILRDVTGRAAEAVPALVTFEVFTATVRRYVNWRDLYTAEFGFSEDETDRVGRLWTEYQLADETPVPLFDGIAAVLGALTGPRHGIVSMNGRRQIARTMAAARVEHHFQAIVGWEDVPIRRQKPEPDGMLQCLAALLPPSSGGGIVLYVGDHETDARCAANANAALRARGADVRVLAVAACFTGEDDPGGWSTRPDYVARHPREVASLAQQLGA